MNADGVNTQEFESLLAACRGVPVSAVQQEENEAAQSPILILMSTVLSLNRRWYSHALPARQHFERNLYRELPTKSLAAFREIMVPGRQNKLGWLVIARALWSRNEWYKAQILAELVDYFVNWISAHAEGGDDLSALKVWASKVKKEEFLDRKIKGLGPRAYEQLCWYIDGKQAIKIDRHITSFVERVVRRNLTDDTIYCALKDIATVLNTTPTTLDACIWDLMQRQSGNASNRTRRECNSSKTS